MRWGWRWALAQLWCRGEALLPGWDLSPVGAGHSHGPQLPYPACLPIPEGEDAAPNPIICLQDRDLKTGSGKQEPQLP